MRSDIHSCIYSLVHDSSIHSFICFMICWFSHSLTHAFMESFHACIHTDMHWCAVLLSSIHPLIHSSTHSASRWCIHVSIHPLILACIGAFTSHLLLVMLRCWNVWEEALLQRYSFACVTLRLLQNLPWWMSFWECRSLQFAISRVKDQIPRAQYTFCQEHTGG